MWRSVWAIGMGIGLLAGAANAEERLAWQYDRASEGVLTLSDVGSRFPYEQLSLTCHENGDLVVEARGIRLWSDVNGPVIDPEDLQTLALEVDLFRIEAPLEKVNTGFSGWAAAQFPKAGALAEGLTGASFLVVRAVNRKPVLTRGLERGDYSLSYPPPDYEKSEPFRQYCAKMIAPVPQY